MGDISGQNQPSLWKEYCELASGYFSSVHIYVDQYGQKVAGKTTSKKLFKHWEKEWEILRNVGGKDENIVQYIPHVHQNDSISITLFLELCDANLEQYILNKDIDPCTSRQPTTKRCVPAKSYFKSVKCPILKLLYDTALGLEYLHHKNIIYCDLKPSNILLIRDKRGKIVAKVSDFGLSRELPEDASTYETSSTSTKAYMANECYEPTRLRKKNSDMFAFGVTCYFALTGGENPFGKKGFEIEGSISNKNFPNLSELRSNKSYSEEAKVTVIDMIKRLIDHDPKKRISVKDVLRHPSFYTNEEKLDFLDKVHQHLKTESDSKILDRVESFDEGLLIDDKAGATPIKFPINEKDLPPYFPRKYQPNDSKSNDLKSNWHPAPSLKDQKNIESWRTVQNWLKVLRDKRQHATEPNMPPEFYEDFGVKGGSYDRSKFVQVFLEPHSQLLIHPYNLFKNTISMEKSNESDIVERPSRSCVPETSDLARETEFRHNGDPQVPQSSSSKSATVSSTTNQQVNVVNATIGNIFVGNGNEQTPATPPLINRIEPPIEDMITTEQYKGIRIELQEEMATILHCHGVAGCGKSQIIRKMAEDFPFTKEIDKNASLIKWHIQCKDRGHSVPQQLKILAERILKQSPKMDQAAYQTVVDNLEMNECRNLVDILVEIGVPVVILVEDPPSGDRERILKTLCRSLNEHAKKGIQKKIHVYISSRQSNEVLPGLDIPCYKSEKVRGFNDEEAINYLREDKSAEEIEVALKIVQRFSGLPLDLQAAKAHCKRTRIDYKDYLNLVEVGDYDIINEERQEIMKEYGDAAEHVFQALVMPFLPNNEDDTTVVLPWKIMRCISYFHYDRIPRSVLEQCCHILREEKVKKPQIKNRVEVGALISKLMEHNMCTETDENEITFHEVVLNAFRLFKHSSLAENFKPLEKAIQVMCGLVSKDMRKKDHARKMHMLRRHLQSVLAYIEKDEQVFNDAKDPLLLKALTSHLYETTAAIMLNDKAHLCWKEAEQYFEKSLNLIWPATNKYTNLVPLEDLKDVEKIAQGILKESESEANQLPDNFAAKYASKLRLCFDEQEFEFLEKQLASGTCLTEVKKILEEKVPGDLIKELQNCCLFLSDDKYHSVFYAERFASILHTWSRLVLYGDSKEVEEVGEKCIHMSILSNWVSKECRKMFDVPLLTEHLSKTGGWVPLVLKLKMSDGDLKEALNICKSAMDEEHTDNTDSGMYENGMLKEVHGPLHDSGRISLLRYIVRINTELLKQASPDLELDLSEADKSCSKLMDLSVNHAKTITSCLMCLIYCAKYYLARGELDRAWKCFKKYFDLERDSKPRTIVRWWAILNLNKFIGMDRAKACEQMKQNKGMIISNERTEWLSKKMSELNLSSRDNHKSL